MAKGKKAKKSAGRKRDMLVVGSKVKAHIKKNKCMTSSELLETLNGRVYALLDDACGRTKANRRSTVKSQDV